jgi:hypothetical protein
MKAKEKFLERVESEAWGVVSSFKENPIKSIIIACFVIWFIKKVTRFFRGD